MTMDRRSVLLGIGSLAATRALPILADPAPSSTPTGDPAASDLLAQVAEELLDQYPESASYLGLDKGPRSSLKSRLTDHSLEGMSRASAGAAARLKKLEAVGGSRLTNTVRLNLEVASTAHRLAVEGFHFPYGDVAILSHTISYRNSPYVVAQNTGAFVEIPDFLDSHHDITNASDVESYLARLEAYARALDDEYARLAHDNAAGVRLPDFLVDKVVHQLTVARQMPIADWQIVAGFAKRAEAYRKDAGSEAAKIAESKVAPAMERQIEEMKRQREHASSDAGAWKLPEGEAYYAWALRAGTTTNLTPEEVHKLGLEQLRQLQDRMEPLLRAQGLTKGTPGERMTALGKDPRYQFANTDAGRQEILDYVNGRIADIRTRLPRAFATLVHGNLVVKRVPPSIEYGAPDGYAGPGTIDGSQPGRYYINLRDTAIWPRYALPTLSYHEGIPGHVWQGEYGYRLPLIRSLLQFNAYSEGWALYAEQLADELGVYEGDPIGKLGYLQSLAFRACRLVVDTGIHAKRWTRDEATQWFSTTNGSTVLEVRQEVDRYCVWPGQACGYKVGHAEINRLREETRKALGNHFDLRSFDDAVVTNGNVPLTLLDDVIADFIARERKTKPRG
jgi:uncharacterized protein (DUF885 family)